LLFLFFFSLTPALSQKERESNQFHPHFRGRGRVGVIRFL
jgi:hypothetical protein